MKWKNQRENNCDHKTSNKTPSESMIGKILCQIGRIFKCSAGFPIVSRGGGEGRGEANTKTTNLWQNISCSYFSVHTWALGWKHRHSFWQRKTSMMPHSLIRYSWQCFAPYLLPNQYLLNQQRHILSKIIKKKFHFEKAQQVCGLSGEGATKAFECFICSKGTYVAARQRIKRKMVPLHFRIRQAYSHKNGWIFGKVPNGL